MKNGHDDSDEPPNDPKITRIEDARRRRRMGQAGGGGAGPGARKGGGWRGGWGGGWSGSIKELLVGGVIIAMAIGFLVSLAMPLLR
jgi:hypothetical protein